MKFFILLPPQKQGRDGAEQPRCPDCGGRRKLLAQVPSVGHLPQVNVFECLDCGVIGHLRAVTQG